MRMRKKGTSSAFTLIEILIVLAIISILSGAVLVSIQGQRSKAEVNKVLSEISARLQPMMMCWSDGGTVDSLPSDADNVCNGSSAYGVWPTLPTGFSYPNVASISDATSWYIRIDGGGASICCSSAMSQCGVRATGDPCVAGTAW